MEKGDILTHSKEIYFITDKTGNMNRILNLKTNIQLRRLYTDNELERTFALPKQRLIQKSPLKQKEKPKLVYRPPSTRQVHRKQNEEYEYF